ncbi:MAG TPA: helix-turn-helix domain-containing protein [Candidatus Latescibacteria bacterium]|nr:helix-turn-helix domain-containing protein [Candidatus Latescibacterota bacterium]
MAELHIRLKEAREAKGISLEEISGNTRIKPEYLRAMEDGNFSFLPRPYVRMFLKVYAEEVGLDPDEVLAEFDGTFPAEPAEALSEGRPFQWRYGAAVGLVVALGLALFLGRKTGPRTSSVPHDTTAVRGTSPEVLVLLGRARERTWLAVASDGKLFYVGFVPMDREVQWEARERIEVLLGKPHGVEFVLNGRPVDDSGWTREPVRLFFSGGGVEVVEGPFPWEEELPR